mgnify:CR=1 FL=1
MATLLYMEAFQSTPPRGGRLKNNILFYQTISFNPRPRVGGDPSSSAMPRMSDMFQSTPPRGGRLSVFFCLFSSKSFNPRPRVGGDDKNQTGCHYIWRFNPRPRVGGDGSYNNDSGSAVNVSIHAPAWGATFSCRTYSARQRVSIHAPAWGATGSRIPRRLSRKCFNPRPRVGGDSFLLSQDEIVWVSIHAPAWGATHQVHTQQGYRRVSIHAPAWGATSLSLFHYTGIYCFNPRPRVGGDLAIPRLLARLA